MSTAPAPTSKNQYTLNICFDPNGETASADGMYPATFRFVPGAETSAWADESQSSDNLPFEGTHPLAPMVHVIVLENGGTIVQDAANVSKCWFEGDLPNCPFGHPIPTQTSPWTIVFRSVEAAAAQAVTRQGVLVPGGLPLLCTSSAEWPFHVYVQAAVRTSPDASSVVVKTFRAVGHLSLQIDSSTESFSLDADFGSDPSTNPRGQISIVSQ